jgi:hypothetical protein
VTRLAVLGPPLLLPGESVTAYDDLLARVSGNLKPSDIFEEIWVREIVDLIWESLRWRRHQAGSIKAAVPKALEQILKPLVPDESRRGSFQERLEAAEDALNGKGPDARLAMQWAAADPAAIQRVENLLASIGLTMDNVVAQAVARDLDKIERFNRLIASAEWRRNALLREIDRRRSSFAQKVRREIHKIEDAEFKTIEADTSVSTDPANQNATKDAA